MAKVVPLNKKIKVAASFTADLDRLGNMLDSCEHDDTYTGNKDTKKMVIGLLMAMSLLDGSRTPTSLFTDLIFRHCISLKHGA